MPDIPLLPNSASLGEARQQIKDNLRNGGSCPCCGKKYKLQQRGLHELQMASLIKLYKRPGEWVNIAKEFGRKSAEESKMQYWGLIEPRPGKRGEWKISEKGVRFVEGRLKISSHVLVYNGMVFESNNSQVTIRDVLGPENEYLLDELDL